MASDKGFSIESLLKNETKDTQCNAIGETATPSKFLSQPSSSSTSSASSGGEWTNNNNNTWVSPFGATVDFGNGTSSDTSHQQLPSLSDLQLLFGGGGEY